MTEEKLPRKRRPRLVDPSPTVSQPAPKVVTRSLVELAIEAGLTGPELSDFAQVQAQELQKLQILNVKKNLTSIGMNAIEMDAMLAEFDSWPRKGEVALAVLKRAAKSAENPNGLSPEDLAQFAMKLARIGIHQ